MEEKCKELYQKIMNEVDYLTPEEWSEVWMYGEVLPDSSNAYYYYKSKQMKEMVCCMKIPEKFNIEIMKFINDLNRLMNLFENLNKVFKEEGQQVWSSLNMYFNESGQFKVNFSYEDIVNSDFSLNARHDIWEYEVLKKEPESTRSKNVIKRYLEQKKLEN